MSECWTFEKKEKNKHKTTLVVKKAWSAESASYPLTDWSSLRVSNTDYEPFISQGLVSLVGEEAQAQSIHVLRGSGTSQLLLEGVLPLKESSYTGSNVLLQRVELGVVSAPLHVVSLKTNLVSEPMMVGIRPSLHVQGILLIPGNDLAVERVMVNLCESPNPQLNTSPEEIQLPITCARCFPSCAIAFAMAHKLKENKINSPCQKGNTGGAAMVFPFWETPWQHHEEHVQNLTKSLVVTNKEGPELTNKLENHDMPKNTDGSLPLICSQLSYMINRLIQSCLHFHRKPSLKKKYKIRTQCAILKIWCHYGQVETPECPSC